MASRAPIHAIETDVAPPSPRARLMATKLWPPRLRANLVSRPRLLKKLDLAEAAVIVVAAPAGYGKSILVRQWLNGSGLSSAWVSLDSYDNDPLDFFQLVVTALQAIDVHLAAETQQLLGGMRPPSSPEIVQSLLADTLAATGPFVLVLDDYHVVDNPEIHDAMAEFLSRLPPIMRVVIISRTDPPLQLGRLRSRQEVFELRQEDLQTANDEVLELMQQSAQLDVTPSEAIILNERAEGWMAGLQLVGHLLHGQSRARIRRFVTEFTGGVRSIEAYLWEEVIGHQTEAVRTFLLRTSILDRFNGSLCQAVAGNAESGTIIRRLEQDHLFLVSLDDRGQWYRYHHLFAEALRVRLELAVNERELVELHRRAAAWLEEHEYVEEASRHALAGQDWDRADRLLERISTGHYEQERLESLCTLLRGVPVEVLERSPRLAFRFAWALIRSGRLKEAEQPLRVVEGAATEAGGQADAASLLLLQAFRSQYDSASRVIDLCGQALDRLSDDRPIDQGIALVMLGWAQVYAGDTSAAERAFAGARARAENAHNNGWIRMSELAGSAQLLVLRGQLREAIAMLRRGMKLDERYASSLLAHIHIERNELDEAERHLRFAAATHLQTRPRTIQSRIWLGLAKLAWAHGDVETADESIETAIDLAQQMGSSRFLRDLLAQRARFWLADGQRDLTGRWADSCDLDPYQLPDYERFFEHLTFVRLMIDDDQVGPALRILEAVGERAEAQGRAGDLIEVQVLLALAHQREGNLTRALEALDRALALGQAGAFMRVFINEGEAIVPLLRRSLSRGIHGGYEVRILAATESAVALAAETKSDKVDLLSNREVEVLRLVSDGLSNRDIGQYLFISESTVKRHLSTIYEKLAVNSRTQAIDHARRAGLL